MSKKVATCTLFHHNYNYGGILQAYALQNAIEKIGFESYVVDYNDKVCINPIYPTLLSRLSQYSVTEILSKVKEILLSKTHKGLNHKLKKRISLFDSFISKNIKTTETVDDCNFKSISDRFDAFVCGSDQVWNPNAVKKLYLLSLPINSKAIKISYAASISRNALSNNEMRIMLPAIAQFDAVSVREQTGAQILKKCGVANVKTVLDPTMLLSKYDWSIVTANRLIDNPYILVYSFSDCPFKEDLVVYYKTQGIEVYYIPFAKQEYNSFDGKTQMKPIFDVGPAEFLSLIKYADFVYTDSFHGSVFSILFERDFAVYERDGKGKTSKNSRMYDLLSSFRLSNRLIKTEFEEIASTPINYAEINAILEAMRKDSCQWLYNVLNKEIHD